MGLEQDQSTPQGHRTLAAIVFSDVVNYTGRMSRNEEHTLNLVRRDLDQMTLYCEQFEGKVLKFTGDGLLMYFTSAVQAVACALEIQKTFAARASELPAEDVLQHRIGIHLGDVFVSATDVMGDGVNIAARLQSEAEPGGICLSQIVYDVVKKRLALQATYLGPRELKHIQEAIPIYQIVLAAQTKTTNLSADLESSQTLESFESVRQTLSSPGSTKVVLPESVTAELERLVAKAIGPIATIVVKQTVQQSNSIQELLDRLVTQVPPEYQKMLREGATHLLDDLGEGVSKVITTSSPSSPLPAVAPEASQSIDPDFVKQCELELTRAIGPIARLVVQRTLAQQPTLSAAQLIDLLATHLHDPASADSFRQKLLTTLP